MTTTTHKSLRGPRGWLILCKEEHAKAVDKAIFPWLQWWPLMNAVFSKLICFEEADTPEFKEYAEQIIKNAKTLCDELVKLWYAPINGGTENHLIMLDMTKNWITWQIAETALDKAWMTLNKNMIPDDPRRPMDPSGIRFWTPAITTRWMKEGEMIKIAQFMDKAIKNHDNEDILKSIHQDITKMCEWFPVPGINA